MLNPRYPAAAVSGNVETSSCITNALYGALGVLASAPRTMNNFTFGNERYQYYETISDGSGAGFDGTDVAQTQMTNSRLTDPEILEWRCPVRLESYEISTGSGGPRLARAGLPAAPIKVHGRWRNGKVVPRLKRAGARFPITRPGASRMDDIVDLAARSGRALQEKGWLLATAESCTGGGISQAITEIAGSSEWFDCGFVTYSTESKIELLDVPAALIAQHGAVSEEIAAAMAEGALSNSNAHVALSTTGIAGPGGAVPGKPVGTVCFGWASAHATHTERLVFAGDRQAVRAQTVEHALQGLLRFLAQP